MQLKLKWRNPNTLATTIDIYRNDAIVAPADLGSPVATLAGTVTEWSDLNVVAGKTYYYTWKTTNAGNSVFTKPVAVKAEYSLGPGPSELVYGDMSLGFFGSITYADLFTGQELLEKTGLPVNWVNGSGLLSWWKFARNGKILYLPGSAIALSASFITLYSRGLVFGTDDNGAWVPNGQAVKNQKKVISKNADDFIVRLPTGLDDRDNPGRVSAGTGNVRRFSEVADLLYSLVQTQAPVSPRLPKMARIGVNSFFPTSYISVCQEKGFAADTVITIGDFTLNKTGAQMEAVLTAAINSGTVWMPVLELVPNKIQEVVL